MSISVKELNKLDKETYELIDIRSDAEIAHGVMPGAIQVSVDEIEETCYSLCQRKKQHRHSR